MTFMGQIWDMYVSEFGTMLRLSLGQLRDFTLRDNVVSQHWDEQVFDEVPINISEAKFVPILHHYCPKLFPLQSQTCS